MGAGASSGQALLARFPRGRRSRGQVVYHEKPARSAVCAADMAVNCGLRGYCGGYPWVMDGDASRWGVSVSCVVARARMYTEKRVHHLLLVYIRGMIRGWRAPPLASRRDKIWFLSTNQKEVGGGALSRYFVSCSKYRCEFEFHQTPAGPVKNRAHFEVLGDNPRPRQRRAGAI